MHEFQVSKLNITQSRLVENTHPALDSTLAENEIIVEVESFALTANNVTYAALGEQLKYWQFFPADQNTDNHWGIVPVWGFAHVVSSNSEDIPVGEKLFGYFPPSSRLKMNATHVTEQRFIDGIEHRASLPPGYNVYRRVNAEQGYDSRFDEQRMLLFPLYITSYCLWDYLQDNQWFNAEQVLIISASSKTSIGLAYGLNEDPSAPKMVGMTSQKNTDFVNNLGLYQQVLGYDDHAQLDANLSTVVVDMAGNAGKLADIESHLNGNLKYCIQVGLTHWDNAQAKSPLENTPSEMFFAPGHIQKRIGEWGIKTFDQRSMAYMAKAAMRSASWLEFTYVEGLENMAEVYEQVCHGKASPEQGIIIKP